MSRTTLTIRELRGEPTEMGSLQKVFGNATDYLQRVTGLPPSGAEAQGMLSALPEGKSYSDKFVFGVFLTDQLVGCADVIRGFPGNDTATIGLLLIASNHQGRGYGAVAYSLLEEKVRLWAEIKRVRIGVVRTNENVLPFWKRMGFVETGQVTRYRYDTLVSETIVLEKSLV